MAAARFPLAGGLPALAGRTVRAAGHSVASDPAARRFTLLRHVPHGLFFLVMPALSGLAAAVSFNRNPVLKGSRA